MANEPGRALVAPDKFKGTLSAAEVARAIAAGLRLEAELCPVADGGDGTAAILLEALGGEWIRAEASDPLGRRIAARYALLDEGGTAIVEVAAASGLALLAENERDPLAASSRGTGELIAHAIARGTNRVVVACGGSATTDGGAGALEAFDPAAVELVALHDTEIPFDRCASIYAPQKGAEPAQVAALERRLERLAEHLPRDPRGVSGTGAAGGLAGGLWAHGAELVPGAGFVLEAVGFEDRLRQADVVITGEGRLDETSLSGKACGAVALRARAAAVPCHAIVGEDRLDPRSRALLGLATIQEAGSLEAIHEAAARIA